MTQQLAEPPPVSRLSGVLRSVEQQWRLRVLAIRPTCLLVEFPDEAPPTEGTFDRLVIEPGRELGRCVLTAPEPGDAGQGRICLLEGGYDLTVLLGDGILDEVSHKLRQLPLVWQRKDSIRPAFREYAASLVFDLQSYRLLLDDIDRDIAAEPRANQEPLREMVLGTVFPDFSIFFDGGLRRMEKVVEGCTRQEGERQGFYFRRQVWDFILCSQFLARTNLKPRGYAGDSAMMGMVYEDGFRGPSLFSKCMHRHPLRTAAAAAVRNRRKLVANRLHSRAANASRPLRVMSVACGPAAELSDIVRTPEDAHRFEFVLLDQDAAALEEAATSVCDVTERVEQPVVARTIRESVRTMLRMGDLEQAWGRFDFIYTMGLFDYLQQPVAKLVLDRLYALLRPGGELLVGNFHVRNPTMLYMVYWMDWVLVHRTEDEMLELCAGLPNADCSLSYEDTGSQMFLQVRRTA